MNNKSSNWFVRGLIIVLCLFLAGMVSYRFFYLLPKGDLGAGILIVLALLVVLVLSESFNNFSVGSLLSMSRNLQNEKEKTSELKVENRELRTQLITVATTVSQRQTSTNILGIPQDLARMFSVTEAKEDEVREKLESENQEIQQAEPELPQRFEVPQRTTPRINLRGLEQKAIERFLKINDFEQFPAVREAKLMAQIELLDPVSISSPIFDAYINTLDAEIFIEIKLLRRHGLIMFRERLYVMLTKLSHYRALKKSNVFLTLVLVNMPGEESRASDISRFLTEFQPAVSGGLLRIVDIPFTEDEMLAFYSDSSGI